jgi:hypothetical protein
MVNIYNVKFMEAISSNTVKDLKRVYYLFEGIMSKFMTFL